MKNNNQIVRFRIGKESFGVEIGRVQEIVTVPEIVKVPDTPDFLEGIINLRGKIVSVVDLRKRLKLDGAARDKKNRILVTEVGGRVIGLIVDEVSEVLKLAQDRIEPPPDMVNSAGAEYITGVGKLEDKIILLLDLGKVLSVDDLKTMAGKADRALDSLPEAQAA
jgi:purine-binding chemotaxis protein CheW